MQQVSRIDPASITTPNQPVSGGPANLVNVISGQGLSTISGQNIIHAGQQIHLTDQQHQHQMHQQFYFQSPCGTPNKMIPDSHQISVIGPHQGNLQVYPATMTSGGSLQLHSSTPNLINTSFATAVAAAAGTASNHGGGGASLLLQHPAAQQTQYQIAQTAVQVQQHPGQIVHHEQQHHPSQLHPVASQHFHHQALQQHPTRVAAAPLTVQHLTATPTINPNQQQQASAAGTALGINTSTTSPAAPLSVPASSTTASTKKKRQNKKATANSATIASTQPQGVSPAGCSSSLSSNGSVSSPAKSQQLQSYFNSGDMTAAPNDLTLLVQQAMYPSVLPDTHHHYTPPPPTSSPRGTMPKGNIVYTAAAATTSGGATAIVQIPASTPDQTVASLGHQSSHVNHLSSNTSNTLYVNQSASCSIANVQHLSSQPCSTGLIFQAANTSMSAPVQRGLTLTSTGTATLPKISQSSSQNFNNELSRSLSLGKSAESTPRSMIVAVKGSNPQTSIDNNDFVVTFLSSTSMANSGQMLAAGSTSTPIISTSSTPHHPLVYPTPSESRSSVDDLLTSSFLQNDADTTTTNSNAAISDFIDEDDCKDFLERIHSSSPGSASISAAPSPAHGIINSVKTKMDMEKLDSTIDLIMEYVHSDQPHENIFVLPNRCLPPKPPAPTPPPPPPPPPLQASSSISQQINEVMGPPSATMAISVTSSPVRQLQCAIPAASPVESPSSILSSGSSTVYSISGGGGAKTSAIQPQQAQLIQHQYITSAGVPMTSYIVDQIGPAQSDVSQGGAANSKITTTSSSTHHQTLTTQRVIPSAGGYSSTIYVQQSPHHPTVDSSPILLQHSAAAASQIHFSPHQVGVKVGSHHHAPPHHIIMQPTALSPQQQQQQQQRINLVGQPAASTLYTVPKQAQEITHPQFLTTHRGNQQQTAALNKSSPQNIYVPSSTTPSSGSILSAQPPSSVPNCAPQVAAINFEDAKADLSTREAAPATIISSTPAATTTTTTTTTTTNGNCSSNNNNKKRPNTGSKSSSSKRRKPNSAASQAEQQKQLNDAQAYYDELVDKLKKDSKSLLGLIHQPVIPTSSLVVLPVYGSSCDAKFVWNSCQEELEWLSEKGFKYYRYPFSLKCPKPDTSLLMDGGDLNDSVTYSTHCNVNNGSQSNSLNNSMEVVEQIQQNENKFILQHLSVSIPDGPLLHSVSNKSTNSLSNVQQGIPDRPSSPVCPSPTPQTFESSIKLLLNNTKLLYNQQIESLGDLPVGPMSAALHTAQSLGDLIPLEEETQNGSLMRAFQSSTGGKACCGPIAVPYNLERSTPPLSMFHLPNKEMLDQLKITSLFAESANNQYLLESVDKEVQEFSSTQESVKQQQDVVMTPLSVEASNIDAPSSFTEAQSVGSPTYAGPLLTASEAEQLHQALLQKEITPITISTTHSTEDSSGVSTVQVTINGISRSTTGGAPSTSNTDAHPSDERIDSRESSAGGGGGGGASTDSSTLLHGSPIVDSETGEVLGMKQSSHRGVAVDDSVVGTNKEKLHLSFTLSPKSADNIQKMVKNITDMLGINFNSVNYQVTRTDLNTEITVNQNNPTIQPQKFQELEQQIRKQIAPLTWRMEQSQSKDVASCSEASIMDNFTTASAGVRDPTYQDSLSSISSIPSAIANSSPVSCTPIPSNLPAAGKHEEEHLSIPDLKLRSREENFYCRHCEVKIPPNLGIKKSLHDYRTESGLAFKSDPDSEEMSFCSPKCLNEFIQDLTEAGMSAHRFKDDPNFAHPSISTAGTAMNSSVSISSDSNQAPQSNPVPPSHVIEYRQQFFNVPVVLQGPPPRYPKSSLAKRQMSSFADQCLSSFSTSFNGKSSRKKNFGRFRKWRGHRWKPFNILSLHNTLNNHRKVKEETSMEEMRTLIRDYSGALKIRDGECVDTRVCSLCKIRGDVAEDGPGRLLCLDIDVFIHLNCALWCYEVYETMGGSLNSVSACSNKALSNMCSYCGLYGAGLPCYNPRCSVVYHVPCAQAAGCMFFTDRGMYCQLHQPKEHQMQLKSLSVNRRVYISRDENKQVAQVIHEDADGSHHLVRIGSLILHNLGQLLPHQIEGGNFHTIRYIYPVGFKTSRIYWSMRRPQKRCIYQCRIIEQIVYETELDQRASFDPSLPNAEGQPGVAPLNDSNASSGQAIHRPEFIITVTGEEGLPDLEFRDTTCDAVWKQILNAIKELRMEYNLVKMFPQHLVGEELFGLTEPHILRAIESLPGVENLRDYAFKFGRLQLISEMPLAINPSGCARSEPKMRTYFRRARYAQTANMMCGSASGIRHAANSGSTSSSGHHYLIPHLSWSGEQTLYGKQYISSRSQQYKKLKQESKNNVILGRSRIQGLGLFAARDLEKYTMVIEYIGQLIRCELGNRREKEYEAHNRGTYMFRLDDNYIVDATVTGGLARYINHSCQPNCVAEIVSFERESHIIIFANKRIERGEELTYDYKFDYEDTGNKLPCLCGAVSCRKWMN